ncbi:hypothetical protein LCGC14_2038990 [marine sediment metagenome]|uniref:Tyr recombinase domain-containing protein n=1 Tax=marine sediment metagenome TaxID=412755 RepID=A0A0F9ESA4_9ZZZZ
MPIEPDLADLLFEAWMADEGREKVVTEVVRTNVWRDFQIARRAGIKAYSRPLHTLRKNRETDWLSQFPLHVVTEWLGNSPEVALKHYSRAEEGDFHRAAGLDRRPGRSDNVRKNDSGKRTGARRRRSNGRQ